MTRHWPGKTYWLIGASEGLGRALAEKLSHKGAELVLSARNTDSLEALARDLPGPARVVAMDATDAASVARAQAEAGRVDGMVYLAGAYWPMPATEWDSDKAATMTEVNLTGAIRAVGAVLPDMLRRGGGHIVLTGSLSAFRGLPGAIGYASSKAGLMALAESMHCDLRHTGVEVQLVNPGFIRTRLTDKNDFHMPFIMDPGPAADRMLAHMETSRFSCNFPWLFSLVFRLSRLLPDGLYVRLFGARG